MLRCVLKDINGREILAPYPLEMSVKMDEDVPADSLNASFPFLKTDEICGITLYKDEKPVFLGIVDEQEVVVYPDGEYLRIAARSMAALLLDNEAEPCVYDHPSAGFICERYAEPFGIRRLDKDDAIYYGEQTVAKGSSCWNVIKSFCEACYSESPRVTSDGVLYMKGMKKDELLRFGKGGLRYLRISELRKRSAELSAVYVKTNNAEGYELCVGDVEARARSIRRKRYLNALLTDSPMCCADRMLQNGRKRAYSVKLRCLGCLLGTEGSQAVVSDALLGDIEGLYVSSLRYQLTANGEYTDVILKRRIT